MTKNDFASRLQRRWQDRVVRETAERIRLADELSQYRPRYIECFVDEDALPAEADSEGRIEYE